MSEVPRVPIALCKRIDVALEQILGLRLRTIDESRRSEVEAHARALIGDLKAHGGDALALASKVEAALAE